MGLQCCFSVTTLHTLKLSPISILRQSTKIPTLQPSLPPPQPSTPSPRQSPFRPSSHRTHNNFVKAPQWKAAIDFKWIRENKEAVAANVKNRNSNANIDLVVELYDKLLDVRKEVEGLRAERNVIANRMKGKLESSERQKLVEEGKNLKERLVTLEEDLLKLTDELQQEAQWCAKYDTSRCSSRRRRLFYHKKNCW
ncbi:Seryl-tRNA synthetase [Abeliophyllum distichum]|uniref:Seryl-tRNA synthetase n=1 Tax=Abeliophyllum distichum TaxID=126358 RepID=A0ABD1VW40_9LAMI